MSRRRRNLGRTRMPNKNQVLGDYYYREAKREGYRSRSALKLKEIADKYRIFKRGYAVADLGAAPGGWLQIERELVGEEGTVIGIDLSFIKPLPYENVKLIKGDVTDPEVLDNFFKLTERKVDIIVSDLAPKFSGVHDLDHARQIGLARIALDSAPKMLRAGGSMVIKVLQGSEFKLFLSDANRLFGNVKIYKPSASRDSSSEVYLICTGFRG
ncbi:MAG: RlmE family RNA methyltransferase [Candidatus Methanomethylicus sp.]|nr:RlmE family RNA methyltransferase [Candidatus Methanomethylicus sp.]